jgi:HEAT repeat protein
VQPLIESLGDPNSDVSGAAVEALVNFGKSAVEPLIEALKNGDYLIKMGVIFVLDKIEDARAIQSLVQALRNKNSLVRWAANMALQHLHWIPKDDAEKAYSLIAKGKWNSFTALAGGKTEVDYSAEEFKKIGKPAVNPLIEALSFEDESSRAGAAYALGVMKDSGAVQPLIAALGDPDNEVRLTASHSLGEIGDARAVDPLTRALDDSARLVRESVAKALEKIRKEN